MKSIITFLAFIFLSVCVFANYPKSRLVVTNLENTTLHIVIDGRHYNGVGISLALDDLSAGYHLIKVYQVRRVWFKSDRLLYASKVFLKPNYQVNVLINRSGQLSVVEQQMGKYGRGDDRGYGRNDDNDRYGKPANRDGYPNNRY
jgi:hypothetical protein